MRNEDKGPVKRARGDDTRHKSRGQERSRSRSRERRSRIRDRSRSPGNRRGDHERRGFDAARRRDDLGDRNLDRSRSRDRYRYRRASPRRNRSRSPPERDIKYDDVETLRNGIVRDKRVDLGPEDRRPPKPDISDLDAQGREDFNSDDGFMKRMMGFSGFKSTKNTKVPGNNVGAVRKDKQIKARQYMNRVGGFNRALSPTR